VTRWRLAMLIARKDLQVEWASRVVINQVLPFAAIVMVMFAFALTGVSVEAELVDGTVRLDSVAELVAPGLIWLATLFSVLVLVQRAFAIETDDGALDALRIAGVDSTAIYWGKTIALAVQLAVLEALLFVAAVLLYDAEVRVGGIVLLVTTWLTATCGLAVVGTLYGGLAAGIKGRETLLPLLVLPVVAPVLIGATRAVEAALGTTGAAISEGWPWVGLLALFAVAVGAGGSLAFGPLIDE
jgi:heme exporter protein B